jgi:hypothetical protein
MPYVYYIYEPYVYYIYDTHLRNETKIHKKVTFPEHKAICHDSIKSRVCNPLIYGVCYCHKKIKFANQPTLLNLIINYSNQIP